MATEEDASKLQSRKKKKKMLLKEPSKEEEKKKKKKKAKKDKWGQPVLDSWDEPQQQEEEEEEEEEEEAGVGGGGSGGGGGDEDTYERNKVVVSGMPYSATEQQIRELFDGVGAVRHLHLSRFPDSGNFSGLAFLTFQIHKGRALQTRFHEEKGREFISEPEKVDGCCSAYVGNLSWDVTEDDIRGFFEESKIASIRFAFDKKTSNFRGFCHVDFEDDESLERAMKKDQVALHGRPIKIAYAVAIGTEPTSFSKSSFTIDHLIFVIFCARNYQYER
ncbi:putative RNA-binding protein [Ananas comosus]|uniref:Putative RNA-binding protein n=1 Tax=Ananas comosus TaxID=4615 RepID=A0A199URA5_ANACO|nr:putative RNA-binding protein [Ananas comosus]